MNRIINFSLILCFCFVSVFSQTADKPSETSALSNLSWRSIGPANMGGRVSDIEGVAGNPGLLYVATGSGGIWKTTNSGTTWTPIFERQNTISVGDIALEPNNPDVIWVGTGEGNPRNSVSFGDGVYKSVDGGKNWKHMGLKETYSISKIIVHPKNPDIVYVAAIGRLWGPNEERGVFMTTDGGKTWNKTLYIDQSHGASDLDIDPQNPNILYAGMWKFERKPWTFVSGGEQGGLFRSTDGGRTWNKTNGLPKLVGRIGVSVAASNPNVVYAILESKEATLYRSNDKGETFQPVYRQQNIVGRGFYYTTVKVDPTNENTVYTLATPIFRSIDGGRSFQRISGSTHVDNHAFWINPANPKNMWQGQDGGVAVTYDGNAWEYVNNIPLGQFYQVFADNSLPFYNLSGGLQDNGSWTGPSRNREPTGIHNDDWRMMSFGDGFYTIAHPDNPNLFLSESQGGNVVRTDMVNREQNYVVPYLGLGGAAEGEKYRFNWNAPLVASPHDKNTVYIGGNNVFKSTDFGLSWTLISPDLTTNNKERQKLAGGPVFTEATGAEYFCTIISIKESPKQAGQIWVGTDDGQVQVTNDGGKTWTNLSKNVPNIPADSSVSHVEPSRVNANTAYISYDRHKFDDNKPYVFKTNDGGKTWTNISSNLPSNAFVHVVTEDPKNPNLLYAGTELGLYASYDNGGKWVELNLRNLPRVSVHDVLVHPRDNDLILATHGRSLWVFDDATPIQQMSPSLADSAFNLFDVRLAYRYATMMTRYGVGDKIFRGPNPPNGALITYYLKEKPDAKTPTKMQIFDSTGKLVLDIKNFSREKGVNRFVWNLGYEGAKMRRPPPPEFLEFFGSPRGPQVLPGIYTVKLTVGDKTQEKQIEVKVDPTVTISNADLQAQLDLAMKLRDMLSPINEQLRTLDSLKLQIEQNERVAIERYEKLSPEMAKAIADYKKKLNELLESMQINDEDGIRASAKFVDQINGLYFGLTNGNAKPTPAMQEKYTELQTEFPKRMTQIKNFIDVDTKQFNETLQKGGLPILIVGKQN
jgi:photosystem II stability/assembly factor-like uncharacterized protein